MKIMFRIFLFTTFLVFSLTTFSAAAPITLTDTTYFTPNGTMAPEDYDDHLFGDVNSFDYIDYVAWTHHFDFSPAFDYLISASLALFFHDDEPDSFWNLLSYEVALGVAEDGTWDIGEIDTGSYSYDVDVSYLMDGEFSVFVAGAGDFQIEKSVLSINYEPVPEPTTALLFGVGLIFLGIARYKKNRMK